MGFLAPLYALAAAAIVGPILFHLIRRHPKGQVQFSSLMFLQPSPPRLTRRSRLDHLMLLALRLLAIVLIAVAFARPYFRRDSLLATALDSRQVVLLVDTSASMRRPGIWDKAVEQARQIIDHLGAHDRVAIYTIDTRWRGVVPLDDRNLLDPATTQGAARAGLAELQPTWRATRLAEGLMATADALNAQSISETAPQGEIVLITDLHEDSGLEPLQGYPWPDAVRLDVRQIAPDRPGNARPTIVRSEQPADDAGIHVRVEATADSPVDHYAVTWALDGSPFPGAGTRLQVPPGQVRVVPMPPRPPLANSVLLEGDAWEADNVGYHIVPKPASAEVWVVAPQVSQRQDDAIFFLARAPLSTPRIERTVVRCRADQLAVRPPDQVQAIVVEPQEISPEQARVLEEFARGGGIVMVLLARPLADPAAAAGLLQVLLDASEVSIAEGRVDDFALIGQIDYRHPVFRPFADPKYNDFSKIRIWNYRRCDVASDQTQVVGRFDNGDPWVLHRSVGPGHVWVITAGWQPTASSFALSSKFVPILSGMLDPSGQSRRQALAVSVGDPVSLSDVFAISQGIDAAESRPAGALEVLHADGRPAGEDEAELGQDRIVFWYPGLYTMKFDDQTQSIAVAVPPSESRVVPLDKAVFEQMGVQMGRLRTDRERRELARQLQVAELERRQKLWRWLLLAGLLVLAIETAAAGWLARHTESQRTAGAAR